MELTAFTPTMDKLDDFKNNLDNMSLDDLAALRLFANCDKTNNLTRILNQQELFSKSGTLANKLKSKR